MLSSGGNTDLLKIGIPLAIGTITVSYFIFGKFKHLLITPKKFLESPNVTKKAKILEIEEVSHDTKRIRLDLGGPNVKLGLPTGKHLVLHCPNPTKHKTEKTWNGRADEAEGDKDTVERRYTPVTNDETTSGYVDFMIKIYRPGKFTMADGKEMTWADGGKMGLFLDKLKVGDSIPLRGPVGTIQYYGGGVFRLSGQPRKEVKEVGMLAGGTGITPMLQILQSSLSDPTDETKFSLIYCNKTENDILVRDLLDDAAKRSEGRMRVYYTLDSPPKNWKQGVGFVNAEMMKAQFPAPSDRTLVLLCGPPPMVTGATKTLSTVLNYAKTSIAAF